MDRDATSAVENPPHLPSQIRSLPLTACFSVKGWKRGGFIDTLGLGYKMTVYSLSETNLCVPPLHTFAVKFCALQLKYIAAPVLQR